MYYHLDESIFIFTGVRGNFSFLFSFLDEIPVSKQNSPRFDATFCSITSGAILFTKEARFILTAYQLKPVYMAFVFKIVVSLLTIIVQGYQNTHFLQ